MKRFAIARFAIIHFKIITVVTASFFFSFFSFFLSFFFLFFIYFFLSFVFLSHSIKSQTGRMSSLGGTSAVDGFMAKLGACGAGKCAKQVSLPLLTVFTQSPDQSSPSPYVGVINLEDGLADSKGRFGVPRKGVVQVMIYNPNKTGIKIFAVTYDLTDMPPCTHTFLRQRQYVELDALSPGGAGKRVSLRYAIHLRFCSSKSGHVYLHKEIRVVFSHRTPDESEKLKTSTQGPEAPAYSPCAPQPKRGRKRVSRSPGPPAALLASLPDEHLLDAPVLF